MKTSVVNRSMTVQMKQEKVQVLPRKLIMLIDPLSRVKEARNKGVRNFYELSVINVIAVGGK